MKCVDERCFPDPRFPGDENHMPLRIQRLAQIIVQFGHRPFAANHFPSGDDAAAGGCPGNHFADGSDELVAPPWKRLDEFRVVARIAQGFANSQNIFLNDFGIYVRFGPQRIKNFILRHQPVRVLHQIAQHIERFRRQRHSLFPAPQAVVHGIEPERMELLHLRSPISILCSAGGILEAEVFGSLRYLPGVDTYHDVPRISPIRFPKSGIWHRFRGCSHRNWTEIVTARSCPPIPPPVLWPCNR